MYFFEVNTKYISLNVLKISVISRVRSVNHVHVLITQSNEWCELPTMITSYNTAVTDAASEILGKERRRKKPWVTKDVLDLCDERRDLKKKRYEAEGAKEYREANRRVQKAVKKAKEDWIGAQCEEIETCLNKKTTAREHISW